jgi:hypothetical protein
VRGKVGGHRRSIAGFGQKAQTCSGQNAQTCTTVHRSGLETVIRIV